MIYTLRGDETLKDLVDRLRGDSELLCDMASVAFWYETLKPDGHIIDITFSEEVRKMLGYKSYAEFPNTLENLIAHIHPDDVELVIDNAIATRIRKIEKLNLKFRMCDAFVNYRWFNSMGKVVQDSKGNTVGMIGSLIDINEKVALEEELKAKKRDMDKERLESARIAAETSNKAKTNFLFNMSHDIRTPMNAITGLTELLKKHLDNKEQALTYLEKLETANNFLLSLINNVLELARIESGTVKLDESPSDIVKYGEELFSILDSQFRDKNLSFTSTVNVQHPIIMVDGLKIKEIILNLLSNSLKYTPVGGSINASLTELPSERAGYGKYVSVFEDTGIGMSEGFLPHIFDEFERERNSTESQIMGTGLGMPIVKKLIDLMQGTIKVESELGKGTKITVTLDHRIVEKEDIKLIRGKHTCDSNINISGKRILLAEDNQLNADIAMEILGEEGLLVEHATDGIIAVDMVEKAPSDYYDLILMDVQMPNMNGYKATQMIRRLPDLKKSMIPIFAMTANAFEEDRKDAFIAGMNGHIAKPIQIEILKNTLCFVLNHGALNWDTYRICYEYFSECKPFIEFNKEYSEKGLECGCFVYEATGNEEMCYANDSLIRIFGCEDYDDFFKLIGGSFKTLVYSEDIDKVENDIAKQISFSEINIDRVQYRIKRKDGTLRMIDDIGRKVYMENGDVMFCVCVADITDLKRI